MHLMRHDIPVSPCIVVEALLVFLLKRSYLPPTSQKHPKIRVYDIIPTQLVLVVKSVSRYNLHSENTRERAIGTNHGY